MAFWVGLLRDFASFPTPNLCFFVSLGCRVVAKSIFGRGFFKNWLVQWSGLQWLGSFQNNYLQSAPLPVVSRATAPLIGVVTPVGAGHLFICVTTPITTSIGAHLFRNMCEPRKVSSPRQLLLLTAYAAVWWPDVTSDIRRNMDPLVFQQYPGLWGPQHKLRAVGGPKTPSRILEDKISMGL